MKITGCPGLGDIIELKGQPCFIIWTCEEPDRWAIPDPVLEQEVLDAYLPQIIFMPEDEEEEEEE